MSDWQPLPVSLVPVASDRAWLDPQLVSANLYLKVTDVTVMDAGTVPVAILDNNRWAIGFTVGPGGAGGEYVAPWSDAVSESGVSVTNGQWQWFDLPRYGPLVCAAWSAQFGSPSVLRVFEIIRSQREK